MHRTVNHSLHLVDPVTVARAQGVEGMWSACKRMMREEKSMNSQLFDTQLPEYMWRVAFGRTSLVPRPHTSQLAVDYITAMCSCDVWVRVRD